MIDKGIKGLKGLSEVSGIDRNTLSRVMTGKTQPSSYVMESLVRGLGIEPWKAGEIFFKIDLRDT